MTDRLRKGVAVRTATPFCSRLTVKRGWLPLGYFTGCHKYSEAARRLLASSRSKLGIS